MLTSFSPVKAAALAVTTLSLLATHSVFAAPTLTTDNGTTIGTMAPPGYPNYGSTYSGFWRAGAGDYTLLTDGTNSFLNAPGTSGTIYFRRRNADVMTINPSTGVSVLSYLSASGPISSNDGFSSIIATTGGTLVTPVAAVLGWNKFTGGTAYGVSGIGVSIGTRGESTNGNGVEGQCSGSASGVYGHNNSSNGGIGVAGRTAGTNAYAVYGDSGNMMGSYAGFFDGDVNVHGMLTKTSGAFMIDHPLDRENKVLRHSFVEAPEMLNVYSGVVQLNERGEAWVKLPAYFGALNRDYRYQLTNIGAFAPTYVAEEVKDNKFRVAGGKPGMKVSWQVSGVRQDLYATDHRIVVEEEKAPQDRGRFIYAREGELRMTTGFVSPSGDATMGSAPSQAKAVASK